ncbi:Nn.00g087100.m01.CDS01 [Neocucurbitaria sp. VM-36]
MVDGWATRSVAVSTLILRTAIDLQAAIASAILASLLLESRNGVNLYQIASISPMRAGTTNPWTFASCMIQDIWRSTARYRRNYQVYLIATCLLITTSVLQFSSTILLSDLKLGPLVGHDLASDVRVGLSYVGEVEKIPRDSAWTTNPPSFPAFGEYFEPPASVDSGVVDTGLLFRAFLPYSASESRQRLSNYHGNALVLDARVVCQAPLLTHFNGTGPTALNRQLTGIVAPTKNVPMLQNITATPFDCPVAWEGQVTICQIAQPQGSFTGSLASQFVDSKTYGTAFLVINASSQTSNSGEWLEVSTLGSNTTAQVSMSLCFAPWDAAVLKVNFASISNRTESALRYWKGFQTSDVLNYLIPIASKGSRPCKATWESSSAAVRGTIDPLPGNWSAFITGTPLVSIIDSFEKPPTQVISADPALAAIFSGATKAGYSIEWALSSLLTVLSMTNYYGQQAAFDRLDNAIVSFFDDVLYPRDYIGFTTLMWVLVAHFFIMATLIVLFVTKTRLTLLGNAWSAFAQVAESHEAKEYVANASLKNNSRILKDLQEIHRSNLRARVIARGEGAEIAVE